MGRIILASSSPRRRELMRRIGLNSVEVVAHQVDETLAPDMPPEDSVAFWSEKKARSVADGAGPDDIVIAGDTLVWFQGQVLGKPADEADAFRMLSMLSGAWHSVYTGITVIRGDKTVTEEEVTSVLMRRMSPDEISGYISTGEPLDKAGAYGIQERGALLCERVDGDFYNVMGLPLFRLGRILSSLGIELLTSR